MWSRQVNALFDGYDLSGHLDGSMTIPPPTITTDGQITTNPAYQLWKRQDRLIYSPSILIRSFSHQPYILYKVEIEDYIQEKVFTFDIRHLVYA